MSRTYRKLPEKMKKCTLIKESDFQMIDGVMFEYMKSSFGSRFFRVTSPRGDNVADHVRRTNAMYFNEKYKWGYPWIFRHFHHIQERCMVSQEIFNAVSYEEHEFVMPIVKLGYFD